MTARCGLACLRLALAAVVLAACGTNVERLMQSESRSFWQHQEIVRLAEREGLSGVRRAYAAEAAKERACRSVIEAAHTRRMAGPQPWWSEMWAQVEQTFVRVVPVPEIERCAEAHRRYRREVAALCRELGERVAALDCPPPAAEAARET